MSNDSMMWRANCVVSFVLSLLIAAWIANAARPAAAQEAIDQFNPDPAWNCLNPNFFNMSQGFTPTFSRMNFADIYLTGNSGGAVDGEFSLRVLRNGVLQRESEIMTIPADASFEAGYQRFEFPSEVFLATGQPYELELVNHSNTGFFRWCQSQNDSYAGGEPMVDPPGGSGDFLFRTGMQTIIGPPQAVTHGPGYMVFESALEPQQPVSGGGVVISDNFFSGLNFEVAEPTKLSRVGGHFNGSSGTIFAAVFQTNGFAGVPDPTDLSGPDVLATTLIDLTGSTGEAWADIDVTLQPGWHGILFGSGQFGATATFAGLKDLGESNGPFWNTQSVRQSDGLRIGQAGDHRVFAEAESAPGTAQARPAFDTTAEQFGGQWILTDGDSSITADRFDFFGTDERALMEFDLSEVPAGATVTGATLRLVPDQLTSGGGAGPQLFFHGYEGDGAASAADAMVPLNEIGSTPVITEFDPFEVQLDAAFIQSLVDAGATHLGLMARGANNGHRVHFKTWEDGRADNVPLLTIEFDAPLLGDSNGDGVVNTLDINAFVLALTDEAQYAIDFPGVSLLGANDTNGDGVVNTLDINPFVALLTGGASAAPEPTGISLLLAGAGAALLSTRRRPV